MTGLKDIMAISGFPGLFKFVAQGRNGIIVESLLDGKRMTANPNLKISSLEDIAVYTGDGEVKLEDVLKKIRDKAQNSPSIDPRSGRDELVSYFTEILPEYDRQRVYPSDIKKIISWYNLLQQLNMLGVLDVEKEEEEPGEVELKTGREKKEKPESKPVSVTKQKPSGAKKMQKTPAKKPAGK